MFSSNITLHNLISMFLCRKRFIAILVFFFLQIFYLNGQNISLNLRVVSGGNISYIFNSLTKYQTGITYEDWTRLQIFFNDTTNAGDPSPSTTGWELKVRAIQNGIMSDGGNLNLDTELIKIRPRITAGGNSTNVNLTNINLTNGFQTIVEGDGNQIILEEVFISYDCGVDPSPKILNNPPDFYYVDLEVKIFPKY